MLNIEKVKVEIVDKLKPLKPNKIILFGSYAYGIPNEESDIDLMLIKDDIEVDKLREYRLKLQQKLIDLQKKYLIGIDLFVDSSDRIEERIKNLKD